MSELIIKNLHVEVENKKILKGVNLTVKNNELVAILGPNGHGKSTLLSVIMGNPKYKVVEGEILFDGENVLKMSVDERSKKGIFLGFQNPYEIPGLNTSDFYKAALNAHEEKRIPLFKFYKALENGCKDVKLNFDMMNRNLNDGFSGGEKKRNEILQMLLLNPKLAMLDEIDSGLDVDALNIVSDAITKQKEKGSSFLVVSHYDKFLNSLKPDKVAVIINGRVACIGGEEISKNIASFGYQWVKKTYGIEIEKEETSMNQVSIGVCATKEIIKDEK